MAKKRYRQVYEEFWTGTTGVHLRKDPLAQRLALYLITGPLAHMTGLFMIPLSTAARHVGLSRKEAREAIDRLERLDFLVWSEETEWVWVKSMGKFQVAPRVVPSDNRHAGLWEYVMGCEDKELSSAFYSGYCDAWQAPYQAPSGAPYQAPPQAREQRTGNREQRTENNAPPRETSPSAPASLIADAPKPGPTKREREFQQVLDAWNQHNPGRPVAPARYFSSKLKARIKDEGVEKVLKVVKWWWTSPSAEYLRNPRDRKPYKLDTLCVPANFSKYLNMALDEEHAANPKANGKSHTVRIWEVKRARWISVNAPPGMTSEEFVRVRNCDPSKHRAHGPEEVRA